MSERKKREQLAVLDPAKAESAETLKSWALVELFGHQKIVGWMTVDPPELPGLIRVDVPDLLKDGAVARKGFTRYFGRAAIYGVTPIDEETVRRILPEVAGAPQTARPYSVGDSDSRW